MPSVVHFVAGALGGGGMVLFATAGLLLLKAVRVVPGRSDAQPRHLLSTNPLFMLMIVAVEELIFRHVLVGKLASWIPLGLAILASVVADYLLHIPNGHQRLITFVNSALFSVATSLCYLKFGLAAAIGLHWGWNLMQWTILGYPMYGKPVGRWLYIVPTGAEWLTGGDYGIENSLLAGLALVVGAGGLALLR